eukprot:jgi/Botrbrau1/17360/Bobra.0015s0101.1
MGGGAKQILWAQCEKCEKWRKLPTGTVVDKGKPWFCWMSPDRRRNQCTVPEESYSDEDSPESSSGEESQPPAKKQKTSTKGKGAASNKGSVSSEARNGFHHGLSRQEHKPNKTLKHPSANGLRRPHDLLPGPSPLSRSSGGAPFAGKPPLPVPPLSKGRPAGLEGDKGQQPPAPQVAPKVARGIAKAKKGFFGCQKLLGAGGQWSIAKGRGRTITPAPQWMWEAITTFAPNCAPIAVEGADLHSACRYFEMTPPNGKQQAQRAALLGRLALTLGSAVASTECSRIPGVEDQVFSGPAPPKNPSGLRQAVPPGAQATFGPPAGNLSSGSFAMSGSPVGSGALPPATSGLTAEAPTRLCPWVMPPVPIEVLSMGLPSNWERPLQYIIRENPE